MSLYSNTTGSNNTANGYASLYSNTTGIFNTANGALTLYFSTGNYNTGNGNGALYKNTTGSQNTANGFRSLYNSLVGNQNTADGYQSLFNSTGIGNIGLGYRSGFNLATGSYNIAIGNQGIATENGAIRIGTSGLQKTAYIAGINGVTSVGGVAVYINASGQLGTVTSSRRFKNEIKTMGNVSDKLLKLRPVTFRYKSSDSKGGHPLQYGLIAEEVAKVFPDLVQYDKQGKPFTIYYHLLTPMILNELKKERATRKAEVAILKASYDAKLNAVMTELAQQKRLLSQLAAYVQNSKNNAPIQKVNVVQH